MIDDYSNENIEQALKANKHNSYADVLPFALNICYPRINYQGLILQDKEFIIYAAPVELFTDKEKIVNYVGRSSGFSFRIAKGVSYRVGGGRGTPVRQNVRDFTSGDLVITNNRVIFIAQKNGFEFKVEKISVCKLIADNAITLQAGAKNKNFVFDKNLTAYILGFINTAIEQKQQGLDLYTDMPSREENYTPEIQEKCKNIVNSIKEQKQVACSNNGILNYKNKLLAQILNLEEQKNKNKIILIAIFTYPFAMFSLLFWYLFPMYKFIKTTKAFWISYFVIPLLFTLLAGTQFKENNIQNSNNINLSQSTQIQEKKYSEKELVTLANHPRIGDTFQAGLSFKQNINDSRVKVLTSQEHGRLSLDTSSPNQNATLYLIEDPSGHNEIGEFEVNIKNENITLNDAIEIIKSYLPVNFSIYYQKDSAYYKEFSHAIVYSYAVRLNNKGYQAISHNGKRLSVYLSFYIYEYKDGTWKICSDYSAYGGKSLDWINNYGTTWNINLN